MKKEKEKESFIEKEEKLEKNVKKKILDVEEKFLSSNKLYYLAIFVVALLLIIITVVLAVTKVI